MDRIVCAELLVQFNSLMACGQKLSLNLVGQVRKLLHLLPDGMRLKKLAGMAGVRDALPPSCRATWKGPGEIVTQSL